MVLDLASGRRKGERTARGEPDRDGAELCIFCFGAGVLVGVLGGKGVIGGVMAPGTWMYSSTERTIGWGM